MFEFIKRPIKDSLKSNMSVGRKLGLSERNSELLSIGMVFFLIFGLLYLLFISVHMIFKGYINVGTGIVLIISFLCFWIPFFSRKEKIILGCFFVLSVDVLMSSLLNEFFLFDLPFENGSNIIFFLNEFVIIVASLEIFGIFHFIYKSRKGEK